MREVSIGGRLHGEGEARQKVIQKEIQRTQTCSVLERTLTVIGVLRTCKSLTTGLLLDVDVEMQHMQFMFAQERLGLRWVSEAGTDCLGSVLRTFIHN